MSTDTSSVVQYVLSSLRRAAENAYSWSLTPNEAGLLVAEVERLRAEVSYLRACVPPMRPTDYGHEVWTETVRAEVKTERAAVVAWLQAEAQHMYEAGQDRPAWFTLSNRAERIERGEHHHNPAGKEKP